MSKDMFDGFTVNVFLDEDGDYLAHFVEMPNVSAFSDTPENALKELAMAWKGVKESYHKHNEPIPQAPSQEAHKGPVNVPVDEELDHALTNEAAKAGMSPYSLVPQKLAGQTASEEKIHDLYEFMRQLSNEMSAEYHRIQMRATEDPGTAGDQGEENWAELLRGWLPRTYEVVTKGRIISRDGETSPQVDVLVLKGAYPKKLLTKKLYLAAGVAAAFECKTTLKASHIEQAVKTCVDIKNLYPAREGTPYKELHAPIIYGLLTHSHSWKASNSTPEANIEQKLLESDYLHVSHPRQGLDLLCVADLAAWTLFKMTFVGPQLIPDYESSMFSRYGPDGAALSSYVGHTSSHDNQVEHFTPIGTLISNLSRQLAWEDSALRDLADYYRIANIAGLGGGNFREWSSSIYSEEVRRLAEAGNLSSDPSSFWDEWRLMFY